MIKMSEVTQLRCKMLIQEHAATVDWDGQSNTLCVTGITWEIAEQMLNISATCNAVQSVQLADIPEIPEDVMRAVLAVQDMTSDVVVAAAQETIGRLEETSDSFPSSIPEEVRNAQKMSVIVAYLYGTGITDEDAVIAEVERLATLTNGDQEPLVPYLTAVSNTSNKVKRALALLG